MTAWIGVPDDRSREATRALVDAGVKVEGTWTVPAPGATPSRRDPATVFLAASFGATFLGLAVWGLWAGGWWSVLGVLSLMAGLMCIEIGRAHV